MAPKRLITQNLLAAADQIETGERIKWSDVNDFAVFVDLFCLYEDVQALGRRSYSYFSTTNTSLREIISEANFVRIAEFNTSDGFIETACAHLSLFLDDDKESRRYSELVRSILSPDSVERALSMYPDGIQSFETGELWLKTAPDRANLVHLLKGDNRLHREITFVIRTFLYSAYADIEGIPFTPDTARSTVLGPIIAKEQEIWTKLANAIRAKDIAGQLTDSLRNSFEQRSKAPDFGLTRRISPLAAIAIERSRGNRRKIYPEVFRLRRELAPMRRRLEEAERIILNGTSDQELASIKKWNAAISEIEKAFGQGEGVINWKRLPGFSEASADIIDDPTSTSSWVTALVGLPIETIRKISARNLAIEVHSLRSQLPGSGRLQSYLSSMFGKIED
jgi:hypothetical protein